MTKRSTSEPCFQAASTPSGTAMLTAMIRVQIASASVGSTRWAISSATVFLKKKLSPKLPRSTSPIQMANCVQIGSFEPELGADGVDLLGGGVVAGDHRRRIARRQPQHEEDEASPPPRERG